MDYYQILYSILGKYVKRFCAKVPNGNRVYADHGGITIITEWQRFWLAAFHQCVPDSVIETVSPAATAPYPITSATTRYGDPARREVLVSVLYAG
ncbi:MAG: hypothetical protein D6716_15790 [Chloroflexi bacterium]|nr:MAG: hypothetical protein D6716_15790 [Chloroflexota bacterium]